MPISIKAFHSSEVETLSKLSKQTFLESHGHSADAKDIEYYVDTFFNQDTLSQALNEPDIHYSKILVDHQLAGYTKLILNSSQSLTHLNPVAKFERLYLLKDFYGLGLGEKLLVHNKELSKAHHQKGLWLFVWTENLKAFKFYQKSGFQIIGEHDFKISDNHSNPNYVMLKEI